MLADYELQSGDQISAIQHYIRGLKKDSLMNYARINLSAAYSGIGKNEKALKTLKEAAAIDQTNDRIFYNLGLLYYEMQDISGALTSFEKATRLGSGIPGVYYNYGLLLQQQSKLKEAEQVLLSGYSLDPTASTINYALAYLYLQEKLPQKAMKHAKVLQQTDPFNPDYQQLFRTLGL
jgi:tetratricopeptide (TPR) repeat protein